ncbi:MAG: D-alanyl-D-alanine carboxypeptidase [Clostridia bacterium]|nr:D-alanyl-D-alanine carboxypeptidase [Clostridia bacterium]
MKKILALILVTMFLLSGNVFAKPAISSGACILIDAETGQILYSQNANERMYPASITKLLTIYLACEKGKPGDIITVSKNAVDSVPRDTSNIALDYGEKITVEDAICAAMLMSANDAANVLAEYVSGSTEEFAKLMNKTANEMGVKNSNFVNPSGLHNEEHYTTAYDFAMIVKSALANDKFMEYFSSQEYTIGTTNKKDETRYMVTQHRMMHWPQYAPLNVIGGKSGYTSQAMFTLVTYGEKNGKKLITVVLNSQTFTDVYKDTQTLLEYGYNDFEKVVIKSENIQPYTEGRVTLTPKGTVTFLLDKEYTEDDLNFNYKDEKLNISLPDGFVIATMSTDKTVKPSVFQKVIKTIGIVLVSAIVLVVLLIICFLKIENNKKKKRDRKKKFLYK